MLERIALLFSTYIRDTHNDSLSKEKTHIVTLLIKKNTHSDTLGKEKKTHINSLGIKGTHILIL